jgi:ABC-type polar amino acid transport system ATPase subunit
MKLTAFRIKNFRSIIDTKWQVLAFDNITSLIGQNESGKTSVLEGLRAFYNTLLIEDMLRSDLSLPKVSCRFEFNVSELENSIDINRLHPDVQKKLASLDTISISRIWENDLSSYLETGEELDDIYKAEEDKRKIREIKINKLLQNTSKEILKVSTALEKAKKSLESTSAAIEDLQEETATTKKSGRTFFSKGNRRTKSVESNDLAVRLKQLEEDRKRKKATVSDKAKALGKLTQKTLVIERISKAESEIHQNKNELSKARDNYAHFTKVVGLYPTEKEIRVAEAKDEQLGYEIEEAKNNLYLSQKEYDILLRAAEIVYEGSKLSVAIDKAEKEIDKLDEFMGSRELAEELFKLCPEFELFEDFSSLLPNRIDLEDIVTLNSMAEGYKAAINFLTITGLDYSFFLQPNSRILKQKIENLNGELTLNFQDFWRQNVGKNNKIKINFELAHYDHTDAEKSGKPFIEFWIKDDSERLYPKQRSRGVRWFLSFFLELKATAMDPSRKNKVLLIDEPGVSLHARAQEDVLMVFDDIKEQMQIIYSTHSPHLIDVNKLYRVIAVQRAVEDDMNSETLVFNTKSLRAATADTLSPIYSMMGARLSQQEIIKAFNNVVVKDLATFYLLKAILILTDYKEKECYFIPASGASSMPMIINILVGWGVEYLALNFGNEEEKFIYNKLRKDLFENSVDLANIQIIHMSEFMDVEDMFSTIDFKKYVVHVREGITVSNSEYLKDNNHSRAILASNFLQEVNKGKISFNALDEETRDNLNAFIEKLGSLLK